MPDLQPPTSNLQLQLNRILVILPNWFGETLFATPFLRALRQQRPQATIAGLGWPQCAEVLRGSPHLDAFVPYDEAGRDAGLAPKWRLVGRLRERAFDTAFLLRKSLSRSLLVALAGIRVRVGFGNAKSGWLLTHRAAAPEAFTHKAASYLPLLAAVGLQGAAGPYDYTVSDEERAEAKVLLAACGIGDTRPLIVLHPGANWFHKRWLPERFAALGDRLVEQRRGQVLLTGGPADVPLVEAIRRRMRAPAAASAGQTTLRQLAACLERASLVVSNDTGVLHIAAALRRPVVALYGPTSPRITGPLGDPQRTTVLHHPEACPQIPCYDPARPPHPGMASITVDEAYDAACKLLECGMRNAGFGIAQP